MLVLYQMPHVFIMFYMILWIYWTNLLIVAKVHNVLVLHFDVLELLGTRVSTQQKRASSCSIKANCLKR